MTPPLPIKDPSTLESNGHFSKNRWNSVKFHPLMWKLTHNPQICSQKHFSLPNSLILGTWSWDFLTSKLTLTRTNQFHTWCMSRNPMTICHTKKAQDWNDEKYVKPSPMASSVVDCRIFFSSKSLYVVVITTIFLNWCVFWHLFKKIKNFLNFSLYPNQDP